MPENNQPENGRFDQVRQEIFQLLRAQLEALANLSGLTDAQLTACYKRQERVRELRDLLSLESWDSADATLPPSTPPPGSSEAVLAGL
jgi:hypothetical protein